MELILLSMVGTTALLASQLYELAARVAIRRPNTIARQPDGRPRRSL
jgi:hypothetical protein